jgi:phosphate:Na+ symporter
MLLGLRDAFAKGDRRIIGETRRLDDTLDKLNRAIKGYLTALDPEALGEADHRRVREILAFATNMEHAGDIIDRNLLGLASKRIKRGLAFSDAGEVELLAMIDRLVANLRATASLFMTGDDRAARLLAAEKEVFRNMDATATEAHFERLRAGRIDTAETSALHLDALRDLKSVNTHLVAAAAYPVLERSGELLPSRLRQEV